jgi:D-arabinose 5-phosphate isomerase GutQ
MDIVQDFNLDYEYFNKIIENNGDIIVSGKGKEGKLF